MTQRRSRLVGRSRRALVALVGLVAVLLGATASMVLAAGTAAAVTPVAAEPRDRQEVSRPPDAVTLAFADDVDPSAAKVVVLSPDGKNVTSGPLIVQGTNVTTRLRTDLDRGTYTVHFRIDGRGGEPRGGAYQFSYGSGDFTSLPDRSWSGTDAEPAVLSGTDPNGEEKPDAPSKAATPGIEVTSQAPTTSRAKPPATDPPPTVKAPDGPTTDAASGAGSSVSATPPASAGGGGGGGGAGWIVGGVLLLLAVGGTLFGLWHSKKEQSAANHD